MPTDPYRWQQRRLTVSGTGHPRYRRPSGLRIRRHRLDQGLTKVEFARLHGIDRNYLHRVEQGEQNLELGSLVRFALALGMSNLDGLTTGIEVDATSLRTRADT